MIIHYNLCDKCDDKIPPDQVYTFYVYKAGNVTSKNELQLCVKCKDAFRAWMNLDVYFERIREAK